MAEVEAVRARGARKTFREIHFRTPRPYNRTSAARSPVGHSKSFSLNNARTWYVTWDASFQTKRYAISKETCASGPPTHDKFDVFVFSGGKTCRFVILSGGIVPRVEGKQHIQREGYWREFIGVAMMPRWWIIIHDGKEKITSCYIWLFINRL